jgi:phosphoribosylformylglycinamidine synthase
MVACTIDEAVRRLIAVGGNPDHIGGVDNFCWPNIQYDSIHNPDGKFKAAQLVRACRALRDTCLAYEIPLLSGKDSMYVDGNLAGRYGETHKVSALETMQFSAISVIDDISRCLTMDAKVPGDLVYVVGTTRNELGGSEYYAHLGYIGRNVPRVRPDAQLRSYRDLSQAIANEWVASVHGIYRGGLAVHLALVAMGANLGLTVDLARVLTDDGLQRDDLILFSESAGRFIVTVDPEHREEFEGAFGPSSWACIGTVTERPELRIIGFGGETILEVPVADLKSAWKQTFGNLI